MLCCNIMHIVRGQFFFIIHLVESVTYNVKKYGLIILFPAIAYQNQPLNYAIALH
jgi:hypothetical protein